MNSEIELIEKSATGDHCGVNLLIEEGVNIDLKDPMGRTALHFAAKEGDITISGLLIKNGADVNATCLYESPSGYMKRNANLQKIAHPGLARGRTPLHDAADGGHLGVARLLVENGADVNAMYEYCSNMGHGINFPWTVLHCASLAGNTELLCYLLEMGAVVNNTGLTPLHLASMSMHLDIAEILIINGANVDAVDDMKRTPLMVACKNGCIEMVEMLINKGADVNAVIDYCTPSEFEGIHNFTSLHQAAASGYKDIVKLLIRKGAKVNILTTSWNYSRKKLPKSPLDLTKMKDIKKIIIKAGGRSAKDLLEKE